MFNSLNPSSRANTGTMQQKYLTVLRPDTGKSSRLSFLELLGVSTVLLYVLLAWLAVTDQRSNPKGIDNELQLYQVMPFTDGLSTRPSIKEHNDKKLF